MPVTYEWDIERWSTDGYDDIEDHDFIEKLREIPGHYDFRDLIQGRGRHRLVLVRNTGDDDEGLQDRAWAYVAHGALDTEFDNGCPVPVRFEREFENWVKKVY